MTFHPSANILTVSCLAGSTNWYAKCALNRGLKEMALSSRILPVPAERCEETANAQRLYRLMCGKPAAFRQAAEPQRFNSNVEPEVPERLSLSAHQAAKPRFL
jgi:hypothetical protein